MSGPTIISLGEVLWDLFPEGPRFGGAPANFACHAAILGGDVIMVSAVGNDQRGREAVGILERYGIDTSLVQVIAGAPTGTVGIELDAKRKPTFTIHEGSAWDRLAWTPELEARLREADAVYFGTLGQRGDASRATIRRALEIAAEARVPRVLDVNLRAPFHDDALIRDSVEHASILKLSDDELRQVATACGVAITGRPEDSLRRLLDSGHLDLVVMTRGSDGALLVSPGETVDQAGIPAKVRDTVGAGDSFTAALVLGALRGEALPAIARRACEVAAAVCAISGAVPEPSPPQARIS
ncbi:MAG: carbohydrate kinase [Akkermansiaceae bacterium]|nr:carbohydrate kinase [Akkermansiaceae bacterium]